MIYFIFFGAATIVIVRLFAKTIDKISLSFLLVSFCATRVFAQTAPVDTVKPGKGKPNQQVKEIKALKAKTLSDSTNSQPKKNPLIDTTIQNKYGDLLNDDKNLNKKYPIWKPVVEVIGTNVFIWSVDRFLLNADYSHIGPSTWKYNLQKGWEWDDDRFGVNFLAHPYSGLLYFNAARSQGYNYWQSIPFRRVAA